MGVHLRYILVWHVRVLLYPVEEIIHTEAGRVDKGEFMLSQGSSGAEFLGIKDGFCLFG